MAEPHPMEVNHLSRAKLVAFGFCVFFALIIWRLFYLQHTKYEYYTQKAQNRQVREVKITPQRGTICSSNGHPLATSTVRETAYLAPENIRHLEAEKDFFKRLARELTQCLYEDEDAESRQRIQQRFEEKMRGVNRLELKEQYAIDEASAAVFTGKVDGLGNAELQGEIEGEVLTLKGTIDLGKKATLSARTADGRTVTLEGLASRLDRSVELTGCLRGGQEEVTLKGFLSRRVDFDLKRKLPEDKALALIALCDEMKLPSNAVHFVKEGKREYANSALAPHVVGCTTTDNYGDNVGVSGVEAAYNDDLSGSVVRDRVIVTKFGSSLTPLDQQALDEATGNHIYLTIDEAIQEYAQEALEAQVEAYKSPGGICVAMDIPTGAVLAMASAPSFDLNDPPPDPNDPRRRNRCLVDAIEPGSVMKVFTATALLEFNKLSPHESIDCHNGYWAFPGGRVIKDSHGLGVVPVHTAFAESSNVAFVSLGTRLEKEEFYTLLNAFGFGRKTGIDIAGEGNGIVYPLSQWRLSSRQSVPIGYEILITPIQVAAAVAAIANRGFYMQPHVLKEIRSPSNKLIRRYEPRCLRRVCSEQTSQIMLSLMEEVVTEGTGKDRANLPGYRVGGKTGTTVKSMKPQPGQDPNRRRYYASFVGVLPIEAPRLVIYIWIDEPQGAKYGGDVAAPVFRDVAEHAARILGIEPSQEIPETETKPEPEGSEETLLAQAAADPAKVAGPAVPFSDHAMPDLTGLSLIEVAQRLRDLSIDAEMIGTGVALRQQPQPGHPLPGDSRGLVIFSRPN